MILVSLILTSLGYGLSRTLENELDDCDKRANL